MFTTESAGPLPPEPATGPGDSATTSNGSDAMLAEGRNAGTSMPDTSGTGGS